MACIKRAVLIVGLLIPTAGHAQSLTLTWTDNANGTAGVMIQRGLSTFGPFEDAGQVAPGVTTWVDAGLPYSTTYCYRVAAFIAEAVSAFSNIACGTTVAAPPPPVVVYVLTVTKQGPGSVTGYPGINCGSVCSGTYPSGSTVLMTAIPANGARFLGWGGACSGTATTCVVVVVRAMSVSAAFTKGGKKP